MRDWHWIVFVAIICVIGILITGCTSYDRPERPAGNSQSVATPRADATYFEVPRPYAEPVPCIQVVNFDGVALSCDWSR